MTFFDLAMFLAVGAVIAALGVGAVSVVSGILHPVKQHLVVGDCRDRTLILHGEDTRDCE